MRNPCVAAKSNHHIPFVGLEAPSIFPKFIAFSQSRNGIEIRVTNTASQQIICFDDNQARKRTRICANVVEIQHNTGRKRVSFEAQCLKVC